MLLRKRLAWRTNSPVCASAYCASVCQRPSTRIPIRVGLHERDGGRLRPVRLWVLHFLGCILRSLAHFVHGIVHLVFRRLVAATFDGVHGFVHFFSGLLHRTLVITSQQSKQCCTHQHSQPVIAPHHLLLRCVHTTKPITQPQESRLLRRMSERRPQTRFSRSADTLEKVASGRVSGRHSAQLCDCCRLPRLQTSMLHGPS